MRRPAQLAAELIVHCLNSGLDTDQILAALATAFGTTCVVTHTKMEAAVAYLVQQMMRASQSEARRAADAQAAGLVPDAGWLS